MVLGGIICALAAPFYIPAWRQEQENPIVAADHGIGRRVDSADVRADRPGGTAAGAQAFLDVVGPFLAEHEAEHNLLFGIAANLIRDPHRLMTAPPYFAAVRRDGEVVAAALMTPPFNVVMSWTDDPDAVAALAADLDRDGLPVPGITAPVDMAQSFVERWAGQHDVSPRRIIAERIYRAERVSVPRGVPGAVRIADHRDRDLLVDWMTPIPARGPSQRRSRAGRRHRR